MEICTKGNNKVILFTFFVLLLMVYISCYNCLLVPNVRFGGKPNYTYEIINTKRSLVLPIRLDHILLDSLVFLIMDICKMSRWVQHRLENNGVEQTTLIYHEISHQHVLSIFS
jgi:hypothetical protein